MNKLYGIISKKNINDLTINKELFDNQNKYQSLNCLLLTSENKPFIKYDCQNKYIIIFNGELLNKDALKCKLRTLGYQFKTDLDEEVIINAYIYYKENCFNYFQGHYSIIIYTSNKMIIARDKLGIKPLFYSTNEDYFVTSNKISHLLDSKIIKPIVDDDGLRELFTLSPCYTPGRTPFRDIKMVKPGEYISYDDGLISKHTYYKLPIYVYNKSYNEAQNELKELVNKSINKLIKDKNDYGSLLSGGIDSSIISLLVNENIKIDTYFLEYNNNDKYFESNMFQRSLDRKYGDLMARYLNTNHKILNISEKDLFKYLIDSLKARDLPGMGDIDSSLYWLLSNIKNEYIFTGECSDELFGGYPWYYRDKDKSLLPWLRNIDFRQNLLKDEYKYLNIDKYLKNSYNELIKDYEEVNIDNSENKRWRKLTYINIYSFMQQLLYRQEMMANANNIKALSPFIDIEIVEFAYNIPYQYKYQNNTEKAILKDAYKNDLPKEITNRIKNPYPKTFSPIYEEMVNNKINELLNDPKSIINMFFKKEMILELINDKNKKIPYYGQLMTNTQFLAYLIQFEEWVKIYNIEFIINKR